MNIDIGDRLYWENNDGAWEVLEIINYDEYDGQYETKIIESSREETVGWTDWFPTDTIEMHYTHQSKFKQQKNKLKV